VHQILNQNLEPADFPCVEQVLDTSLAEPLIAAGGTSRSRGRAECPLATGPGGIHASSYIVYTDCYKVNQSHPYS
jgi:hypothetical protein